MNRAGKYGDVLQLRWKWANNLDALHGNEFAELMEAKVCLTAHELLAHRFIGLRNQCLWPDLIVDAYFFEHRHQVGTACALRVGHGLGCENRGLQRIDRTDVG